jgi:MarR family transcriptional regulator for hemolysin
MQDHSPLNIRQVFGRRLGFTARQWRRAVDERLSPFGLTEATWLPLLYLASNPQPMRQKDLAESVGIESSTLVRLIDSLDQAGLVKRQTVDDRRARILQLTDPGLALVARVQAVSDEIRQQILADISDEELALTLNVIERICAALERTQGGANGDHS